MKFLLSLAALAATCTGLAQGISEAILGSEASSTIAYAATLGWTFESTNAFAVTQLGCFTNVFEDYPLVTSVQVGLWNDSGVLLASNSITPSSSLVDQTRYESITPVALAPGQVYHLGISYPGGSLGLFVAGPTVGGSVTTAPEIQVDAVASANNGFTSPVALAGTAGSIIVGPNFRFQTVPTLLIQPWPPNQVRLSWATAFPGYTLQSKPSLFGPWGNPGLTVTTVGSEYVAFDTTGAGAQFYRLVK
jgi:hypothetical protein